MKHICHRIGKKMTRLALYNHFQIHFSGSCSWKILATEYNNRRKTKNRIWNWLWFQNTRHFWNAATDYSVEFWKAERTNLHCIRKIIPEQLSCGGCWKLIFPSDKLFIWHDPPNHVSSHETITNPSNVKVEIKPNLKLRNPKGTSICGRWDAYFSVIFPACWNSTHFLPCCFWCFLKFLWYLRAAFQREFGSCSKIWAKGGKSTFHGGA